jgi:hypothetical protein
LTSPTENSGMPYLRRSASSSKAPESKLLNSSTTNSVMMVWPRYCLTWMALTSWTCRRTS